MSVNFFRWDGFVLYFNDVYNHNLHKLPWHYIPVLIAVTTPIITLLLMIFGAFDTSYKSIKSRIKAKKLSKFYEGNIKYYLLFLLFVLAPIMAAIILKSNIYNGWRHFYFVYGLLIVVAMGGLKTLIDYKKQALNIALTVAIGGQMVYSGIWIALNPGMQFAYFNPLAVNVTDNFEMDYWNVSAEKCLMQLLDSTKDEKIMISAIDEMGTDALNHAIVILPPEYAKRIQIIDCANRELFKVKYVIVNPSYHKQYELQYTKGYSKEPAFELTDNNSELITQVKVNSYPIMQIYEIKY